MPPIFLNGRHVNDEIRLKKWLEDKEREAEEKGEYDCYTSLPL
jgi:hypothetical protein